MFIAGGAGGVGTFAIMLARQLGMRNLVTTAGNAKSRAYLIEQCGLMHDQIVDYKDGAFIAQAMQRNRGAFDIALDLVGGKMLSACCALLAVEATWLRSPIPPLPPISKSCSRGTHPSIRSAPTPTR